MKKLFIFILIITYYSFSNQVELNFKYNVDGEPFGFNNIYTNSDNINYKVTRLQYYICGFELNEKPVEDLYILADPFSPPFTIGDIEEETLEKIKFDIGVKADDNVGVDPNSYPPLHPLAPKNPSMHWGWAAGYRFWAIEGFSDPDGDGTFDKAFQYHILGDESLRTITLNTNTKAIGGKITLELDFDVQELLSVVDMSKFNTMHGWPNEFPEIAEFLDNITNSNFITPSLINSIDNSGLINISIYPNPTNSKLFLNGDIINTGFEIYNQNGIIIKKGRVSSNEIPVEELASGTYFLILKRNSLIINNTRFIKN